jgi:PTS system trehalose-specific IIC component
MKGEGFEVLVSEGDHVKAGDPLLNFDLSLISKQAKSIMTPIVITNSTVLKSLSKTKMIEVVKGETELMTAVFEQAKPKNDVSPDPLRQTAEEVLEAVGGKNNIAAVTHCVTRLRFALMDESKVLKEKLDNIDMVKGSFSANGQFQVVIGQGTVDKVYKQLLDVAGLQEGSKQDVKDATAQKLNPLQKGVKTLSDIFIPILPAIVTAGLLMGVNNILAGKGIFYANKSFIDVHGSWSGLADMINIIANTAFVFLPGLIGWSAVKCFGGNPLLGIVLGLMMIHPDLLNAYSYGDALKNHTIPQWNLFGWHVNKIGYQGQVLPVLVSSYILARLEIYLKKLIPDSVQLLLVAPIALLVTGFISFVLVGPITFGIGNWITGIVVAIFKNVPLIGGLIYGGCYALLVITGMHQAFLAVDFQLISSTGGTYLWPILVMSNIAQGSAALAMMFLVKDKNLKGMAGTSTVSAYLGITEPAMFGVNLRFKYPFVSALIGAAIAGMILGIGHVKAPSIGVGGIPGFLSIYPQNWGTFFIGMIVAIVVPFVLTFIFGKIKSEAA